MSAEYHRRRSQRARVSEEPLPKDLPEGAREIYGRIRNACTTLKRPPTTEETRRDYLTTIDLLFHDFLRLPKEQKTRIQKRLLNQGFDFVGLCDYYKKH